MDHVTMQETLHVSFPTKASPDPDIVVFVVHHIFFLVDMLLVEFLFVEFLFVEFLFVVNLRQIFLPFLRVDILCFLVLFVEFHEEDLFVDLPLSAEPLRDEVSLNDLHSQLFR